MRPYLPLHERPLNRMHELFNGGALDGNPLGILALVAADNAEFDQDEIGKALAEDILRDHPEDVLYIGLTDYDPLKPVLVDKGFEPTELYGKPQPAKVKQGLYIRKPDN